MSLRNPEFDEYQQATITLMSRTAEKADRREIAEELDYLAIKIADSVMEYDTNDCSTDMIRNNIGWLLNATARLARAYGLRLSDIVRRDVHRMRREAWDMRGADTEPATGEDYGFDGEPQTSDEVDSVGDDEYMTGAEAIHLIAALRHVKDEDNDNA